MHQPRQQSRSRGRKHIATSSTAAQHDKIRSPPSGVSLLFFFLKHHRLPRPPLLFCPAHTHTHTHTRRRSPLQSRDDQTRRRRSSSLAAGCQASCAEAARSVELSESPAARKFPLHLSTRALTQFLRLKHSPPPSLRPQPPLPSTPPPPPLPPPPKPPPMPSSKLWEKTALDVAGNG